MYKNLPASTPMGCKSSISSLESEATDLVIAPQPKTGSTVPVSRLILHTAWRLYSTKETYNCKEPTNRSHPIAYIYMLLNTVAQCSKLQHTATHGCSVSQCMQLFFSRRCLVYNWYPPTIQIDIAQITLKREAGQPPWSMVVGSSKL